MSEVCQEVTMRFVKLGAVHRGPHIRGHPTQQEDIGLADHAGGSRAGDRAGHAGHSTQRHGAAERLAAATRCPGEQYFA